MNAPDLLKEKLNHLEIIGNKLWWMSLQISL